MAKNGRDGTPVDEVFEGLLLQPPKPIPADADRGHFALLAGKLAAQEVVQTLVAQKLEDSQRLALNTDLDRAVDLVDFRLKELRRLGKDREALTQVEGFLRGLVQARDRFG